MAQIHGKEFSNFKLIRSSRVRSPRVDRFQSSIAKTLGSNRLVALILVSEVNKDKGLEVLITHHPKTERMMIFQLCLWISSIEASSRLVDLALSGTRAQGLLQDPYFTAILLAFPLVQCCV